MNDLLSPLESDRPHGVSARAVGRFFGALAMLILGVAAFLGGIALWVGEKSGRFVVFPFAGKIAMIAGFCLILGSAFVAGKRNAYVLGGLLIVIGIVVLIVGLTQSQFPYPLLRLIGAFVGGLGGVLIAAGAGYFDEWFADDEPAGSTASHDPDRSENEIR